MYQMSTLWSSYEKSYALSSAAFSSRRQELKWSTPMISKAISLMYLAGISRWHLNAYQDERGTHESELVPLMEAITKDRMDSLASTVVDPTREVSNGEQEVPTGALTDYQVSQLTTSKVHKLTMDQLSSLTIEQMESMDFSVLTAVTKAIVHPGLSKTHDLTPETLQAIESAVDDATSQRIIENNLKEDAKTRQDKEKDKDKDKGKKKKKKEKEAIYFGDQLSEDDIKSLTPLLVKTLTFEQLKSIPLSQLVALRPKLVQAVANAIEQKGLATIEEMDMDDVIDIVDEMNREIQESEAYKEDAKAKEKTHTKSTKEDRFGEPETTTEPFKFMTPKFFVSTMNAHEYLKYCTIIRDLKSNGMNLSMELAYLIEVVCLDRNSHFEFFDHMSQPERNDDWKKVAKSPVVILDYMWRRSLNHPLYVAVPISAADPTLNYFEYNAGRMRSEVPPFTSVSQDDVMGELGKWIGSLFNDDAPGYLGTYLFQKKFVDQLSAVYLRVRASTFMATYPSGFGGTSGYFFCDHVSPLLRFLPYGPEIILQNTHDSDPSLLTIMPEDRKEVLKARKFPFYPEMYLGMPQQSSIDYVQNTAISHEDFVEIPGNQQFLTSNLSKLKSLWEGSEWLQFIYNICNHDLLTVYIFRTLCQRCIMAPSEGLNYQTGHWIHGVPGSGKTSWAVIISELVGFDLVSDMGLDVDIFSSSAIVGKNLLVLSDVVKISNKIYLALKPMLGRDPTKVNVKHCSRIITVRLYCQFLIIGNKKPSECGPLMQDIAIIDKIIMAFLGKVLPSKYLGGDTTPWIRSHVPSMWPWAVLSNRMWLQEQIRARKINNTRLKLGIIDRTLYQEYIEERLMYSEIEANDVRPNIRTTLSQNPNLKAPNSTDQTSPEWVEYLELVKNIKREQKAINLASKREQCPAHVSKSMLKDDFILWVQSSNSEDTLYRSGGDTSDERYKAEVANLLALKVTSIYRVTNFNKKKEGVHGFEGFCLIPADGIIPPAYRPFVQPRESLSSETLESDLRFVLSGAYPFTTAGYTQTDVGAMQHAILEDFGESDSYQRACRGQLNLYESVNAKPKILVELPRLKTEGDLNWRGGDDDFGVNDVENPYEEYHDILSDYDDDDDDEGNQVSTSTPAKSEVLNTTTLDPWDPRIAFLAEDQEIKESNKLKKKMTKYQITQEEKMALWKANPYSPWRQKSIYFPDIYPSLVLPQTKLERENDFQSRVQTFLNATLDKI